jgi:Fe2+ transport system protein FeoA
MKESEEIMRLDEVEPERIARVMKVQTKEDLRRRLLRQGIAEGNFIRVISCSGPVVVEVDKKVTAMGRGVAKKIMVIKQAMKNC